MSEQDRVIFFQKVLKYMGLTPTYNRMLWLLAQARVENTQAKNNPLATTWDITKENPSWERFNSIGVKNYETMDLGALATAKTLMARIYYPTIIDSFIADKSPLDLGLNQAKLAAEYKTYGGTPGYWAALKTHAAVKELQEFVRKKWKPIAATAGLLFGIVCWLTLSKSARRLIGLK